VTSIPGSVVELQNTTLQYLLLIFGIGFYTKSNCEVCLIATKGKPKIIDNSVSSVIIAPRDEHSKKPAVVREKIVQLCGDLPRVELFARMPAPGWDVIGNEIDGKSIQEVLAETIPAI
jgi:N6-adenosine-specific RNA methylase IME4